MARRTGPAPKPASPEVLIIDTDYISDGGVTLATEYTGEIRDPESLDDLRMAIQERGSSGLAALEAEFADLQQARARTGASPSCYYKIGTLLNVLQGRFEEAAGAAIEKSLAIGEADRMPASSRAQLILLQGLIGLRRGEVENCIHCVGPSSCIFPIDRDGIHTHASRLATGDQALHGIPRSGAGRSAGPLDLERGLHDAGGVPRKGSAPVFDPARHLSIGG